MTIELVLAIAQVVGTLAVVGSVIALVIETRSSTRANKMQAYTLASGDMKRFTSDLKRDPEVLKLYRRGLTDFDGLTDDDRWRFGALMQELMWIYHGWWVLRDDLPMAEDHVEGSIYGMLTRPGMAQWWTKGRFSLPPDFAAFVDDLRKKRSEGGASTRWYAGRLDEQGEPHDRNSDEGTP